MERAKPVQIDIDGRMLSIRYPMEVNLMGDSAETLRALIPLLERKKERSWRKQIAKDLTEWWKVLESRATQDADPFISAYAVNFLLEARDRGADPAVHHLRPVTPVRDDPRSRA